MAAAVFECTLLLLSDLSVSTPHTHLFFCFSSFHNILAVCHLLYLGISAFSSYIFILPHSLPPLPYPLCQSFSLK